MKVIVAGDYAPSVGESKLLNKEAFNAVFGEIKPLLIEVDYSIVNLEAPVIYGNQTPITKTGPNLCCAEEAVEALRRAGFRCVTLANNHFRDQGEFGIKDTLAACNKYGVDYVGGGKNLSEASKVLLKEIKGETIAIVNVCESEWSIAADNRGGSSLLNPINNYYTIKDARKKSDYLLVIVHGGVELFPYPTPRMQETYRFFIDAGADVVVNHHQHCYSGYEIYNGKPILYGLGNFFFNKLSPQVSDAWNQGYMVMLDFSFSGTQIKLIPYMQCHESLKINLLPSDSYHENIEKINKVITDKDNVNNVFLELCKSRRVSALVDIMSSSSNRFVLAAQRRRLLPVLVSSKKIHRVTNLIRCESHRDVLLGALKGIND